MLRALALLVLAAHLALPAPCRADDAVYRIAIEGNTRTRREVVERALGVKAGDVVADEALPALRQRILNLRLFSEVALEKRADGTGTVLAVTVEERWTLIPIPFVGADDAGLTAGLALAESNLFGRRKLLVASGIYSERNRSGFLMYRDPELLGTSAVLAADLLAADVTRERADGFDVIDAWKDRRLEASVRPGLRLARRLELRAGPFVSIREASSVEGRPAPPDPGANVGLAADVEYDGQDYREWFSEGPAFRGTARRSLPFAGSDRAVTAATAHATWTAPLRARSALTASVAGFLADGDPVLDAFTLGGKPGARGVRAEGIWAERAVASTVDLQVPIWRPRWGTMTASAFVDAGAAAWRGERTDWIAPGVGVRLYLRSVAIPAVGFDLAWSTAGDRLAPTFFIGF